MIFTYTCNSNILLVITQNVLQSHNEHKHETLILKVAVSEVGISKSPFLKQTRAPNVRCPILAICFWHQTSNRKACCQGLGRDPRPWPTGGTPTWRIFPTFLFNWLGFWKPKTSIFSVKCFHLVFLVHEKLGMFPWEGVFCVKSSTKTHCPLMEMFESVLMMGYYRLDNLWVMIISLHPDPPSKLPTFFVGWIRRKGPHGRYHWRGSLLIVPKV